jgi:hypothetical protein
MAVVESKNTKDVVIPIAEARGLRDELTKLVAELYEYSKKHDEDRKNEVFEIQIRGGSFK